MSSHVRDATLTLIWLLGISTLLLLADWGLPTQRFEIRVDAQTFDRSSGQLLYSLPGSGGDVGTCSIADAALPMLQPEAEIYFKRSAIFGRCVGIRPIPAVELECRKRLMEEHYRKAIEFERLGAMGEAYSTYSRLCSFYTPSNQQEDPCKASLRLHNGIQKVYEQAVKGLSQYQKRTGKSPASLTELLSELPPSSRQIAKGFVYCKKEHSGDCTGTCSDGGIYYGDLEGSLDSGLSTRGYYDREGRPNQAFEATCEPKSFRSLKFMLEHEIRSFE